MIDIQKNDIGQTLFYLTTKTASLVLQVTESGFLLLPHWGARVASRDISYVTGEITRASYLADADGRKDFKLEQLPQACPSFGYTDLRGPSIALLHADGSRIADLRYAGHRVVLCSGRNYGMLSPLLPYGFDGVISCAGGCIEYGEEMVYDCPMTPVQQEKALEVFRRNGVYRTIGSRMKTYTDEGFKEFLAENAGSKANSELLRWRVQIESELDIRPMAEYDGEPIYGLTFMSRGEERLREPIETLQDEFHFCIQDTDACGIVNGELINKAYHKGLAVERLCRYLNVPREDTIAFGGSMNDLELLQTASVGVCMENGSPQLKKAAGIVCPAVTEDGLYRGFQVLGLLGREE